MLTLLKLVMIVREGCRGAVLRVGVGVRVGTNARGGVGIGGEVWDGAGGGVGVVTVGINCL